MKESNISLPKASVTGQVFNVQHFCVDDGPGIRTTVFLKGCPLQCVWCHNPESHKKAKEIMFHSDRCCACGKCVSLCENKAHQITADGLHLYDHSRCSLCENCVRRCPTHALETIGQTQTVEEVLSEILSDSIFYRTSGGGVTISGGEPTAQPEFTEALLAACKREGLHTCIETCGWCTADTITRLIPYVDLFLMDWKISDDVRHRLYTGVSNQPILRNLSLLHELGAEVVLRCPLIPDINIEASHFDGVAKLANQYANIQQIDLEPYHPMGLGKAKALGKKSIYGNDRFPDASAMEEARQYIQDLVRIPVRISGN